MAGGSGAGWDPGRAAAGQRNQPGLRSARRPSRLLPAGPGSPRPALYLAPPGEEEPGSSGRAPGGTRGGRGGAEVSVAIASRPGRAATTQPRSALPGRLPRSAHRAAPAPPPFRQRGARGLRGGAPGQWVISRWNRPVPRTRCPSGRGSNPVFSSGPLNPGRTWRCWSEPREGQQSW
nr:spidroin-2 [Taeniopygia guttata]